MVKKTHTKYKVQTRYPAQANKWIDRQFASRETLAATRAVVKSLKQEELEEEGLIGEWRILKLTTYEEVVEVVE